MKESYPCICHVCGKEFEIESRFMSGPTMQGADGRDRLMHSCIDQKHSPEEVRAAWNRMGRPTGVEIIG